MATRKPFVNVNGVISELPDGDSLDGVAGTTAFSFNYVDGELLVQDATDYTFELATGELSVTPQYQALSLAVLSRASVITFVPTSTNLTLPILNHDGITYTGVTI